MQQKLAVAVQSDGEKDLVDALLADMELISRRAHEAANFTYAPLEQMAALQYKGTEEQNMSHAMAVCVWFSAGKLDALNAELRKQNTTVETALLGKLEELSEQTAPAVTRTETSAVLARQDRLAAEKDARRKVEQYAKKVMAQ